MKERPIIFSGPMVRAILDGRKTQTRRVVKGLGYVGGKGEEDQAGAWGWADEAGEYHVLDQSLPAPGMPGGPDWRIVCPYGVPGDLLWVRETWQDNRTRCWCDEIRTPMGTIPCDVLYRADGVTMGGVVWRPSIHMPRWASRITLKVTGVRVERVQEISQGDARDEGVVADNMHDRFPDWRWAFRRLWDSINAKRGHGWESNPWVWVVEFEVVR